MANTSTTTGALFISRKTGLPDVTEGDLQGYHPESEFLRIQGIGDVGDVNGISAAFSMSAGTIGSLDSSPEAKLYIRVSGRSTGVTNAFGLIPDTYMMTLAGSTGNVGIGTTDPQFKLDVAGGIRSTSVTTGNLQAGNATIANLNTINILATNITTTTLRTTSATTSTLLATSSISSGTLTLTGDAFFPVGIAMGRDYYSTSSTAASSSNSTTPVQKLAMTTGSLVGGVYNVNFRCQKSLTGGGTRLLSVYGLIDGIVVTTNATLCTNAENVFENMLFIPQLSSGVHTFAIRYNIDSGSIVLTNAYIDIYRVGV
jgi:hypothetical protein